MSCFHLVIKWAILSGTSSKSTVFVLSVLFKQLERKMCLQSKHKSDPDTNFIFTIELWTQTKAVHPIPSNWIPAWLSSSVTTARKIIQKLHHSCSIIYLFFFSFLISLLGVKRFLIGTIFLLLLDRWSWEKRSWNGKGQRLFQVLFRFLSFSFFLTWWYDTLWWNALLGPHHTPPGLPSVHIFEHIRVGKDGKASEQNTGYLFLGCICNSII